MLQNAYFLAKIGADTAENEQHFAENLPKIGNYPTGPGAAGYPAPAAPAAAAPPPRPEPAATVAYQFTELNVLFQLPNCRKCSARVL